MNKLLRKSISLTVFTVLMFFSMPLQVYGLSAEQTRTTQSGVRYFNVEQDRFGCATPNLTGNDNEEKAFNFFRSNGLDDLHTAAVIGNLMQESRLNPEVMQKGGNSQNPADADPLGWGIAQWTPGSKIIAIAQNLNITEPIYELSTQLNIVWAEMTGISPTGVNNMLAGLNQQATLENAVAYFQKNFEGGAGFEPRLEFAQDALQRYGGSPANTPTTGSATGCGQSSTLSPDCQGAQGVARILCAAKQYDPVSYSESFEGGHQGGAAWHASCPVVNASCLLDCSGLVNIAVYDVYHVDLRENTASERIDTQYWQHIPFEQLQPGDLVQPNTGHVEIIDHIEGNTIYTFGAHSARYPQPRQVGPSSFPVTSGNLYLHYVGPGA
jgi:hypothetical protein